MLFSKKKGENKESEVTLNLILQNEKYALGDIVKGTLVLLTNKSYKAKQIKLEVSGVEKTVVHADKASKRSSYLYKYDRVVGDGTKSDSIIKSSDTFYHEDLSSFLKSADKTRSSSNNNDILFLDDGTIEIPTGLRKEFPFQFEIPKTGLESYIGQNVSIEYKVKAVIDRSWKIDINSEKSFIVLNPSTKNVSNNKKSNSNYDTKDSNSIMSGGSNDTIGRDNLTTTNEKEEEEHQDGEEDEQLWAKLEIIKKVFFSGDIIKGHLYLDLQYHDVNSVEISLNAVERAISSSYKEESSWMTKVNKWTGGYIEEINFEKYKQKFEINTNNTGENTFPFEIMLPKDAKKSYRGKLSKYFWEIDAKLNLSMETDKHIRCVIEVV